MDSVQTQHHRTASIQSDVHAQPRRCLCLTFTLALLLLLLAACSPASTAGESAATPPTQQAIVTSFPSPTLTVEPTPTATPTAEVAPAESASAGGASAEETPTEGTPTDGTPAPITVDALAAEVAELAGIATLAGIAPTRTPIPEPTPDAVIERVDSALESVGLRGREFLWVQYSDWINLFISLLMVVAAVLVGALIVNRRTLGLLRRMRSKGAERIFVALNGHLRWLLVVWAASLATRRLAFLNTGIRTSLQDLFFLTGLAIMISGLWRVISMALRRSSLYASRLGQPERVGSFVTLIAWLLYGTVIVAAVTLLFSHFAINITGLAVFIGVAGLGLSLAGRDLLSDLLAGMTILIDQPFRIGDRVDLIDLSTVGVVHAIGMRSTRIVTANNRMVIVPNSLMAKNQVVNYSYPDPALSDGTDIFVAYENDAAHITRILTDALRGVEGIHVEKPVGVWLTTFTETHMVFRLSWWVRSAADAWGVRDRVNRATIERLLREGVRLPYTRQVMLESAPGGLTAPEPQQEVPERPFPVTPKL